MGNTESGALGFKRDRTKSGESIMSINDFTLPDKNFVHIIGQGGFSKVTCMRRKASHSQYFAIKSMIKDELISHKELRNVYNELLILKNLPHSHFVVNLYFAFQDKTKVYMATNLMLGGSLNHALKKMIRKRRQQNLLTKFSAFCPDIVKHFAVQIVLALQFLHSKRIVHRDIKPDNILLDHNGHVRITDLNVSIQFSSDEEEQEAQHDDGWGTMGFRAPEIYLRQGKGMLFACDWWSAGAVLYLLISGELPYMKKHSKENNVELVKRMKAENFQKAKLKKNDKALCKFIENLLKFDPVERIGCEFGSQSEVVILTQAYFDDVNWDIYESGKVLDQKIDIFKDKLTISTINSHSGSSSSKSSHLSVSSKRPRDFDVIFDKSMKLSQYTRNFDKSLDFKAVNDHIQSQFSNNKSKSSQSVGQRSQTSSKSKSKASLKQVELLKKFEFNYEKKYKLYFQRKELGKPSVVEEEITYNTLQLVSSMKPKELKQFIVEADESKLESLCIEMKEFREDYFIENQRYIKSQFHTEELENEISQLRQQMNQTPPSVKKNRFIENKNFPFKEISVPDTVTAHESIKSTNSEEKQNSVGHFDTYSISSQKDIDVDMSVYDELERYRLKSDGGSSNHSDSEESEVEVLYNPVST